MQNEQKQESKSSSDQITYNLTIIRGVPQNPTFDENKVVELIENFETRNGDVFICTYPKAGTTWTQQIIHLLRNNGEQGDLTFAQTIPWLETITSEILGPREAPGHTLETINALPSPRFFKTHATVQDLPRGTASELKVIYVARNPKDIACSLYHHARSKPEFGVTASFSDFLQVYVDGKAECGSWFDHVLNWWTECQTKPETHLFLTYEDMIKDPMGNVRKIALFLGIEPRDELIEVVVSKSSLESMKVNPKANCSWIAARANEAAHLRKGGIGGWRDLFTVSQSNAFDRLYLEKMQETGLTFDFGEGLTM